MTPKPPSRRALEDEIRASAIRPFMLGAAFVIVACVSYVSGYYSRPVPADDELIKNQPPAVRAYAEAYAAELEGK